MKRGRARVILTALVAVPIVVYVADALAVRFRMPLDEVTIYYATRLKNGKVEIFRDTPQRELCVRALFPHLGHAPCWYLRRQAVRLVGRRREGDGHPPGGADRRAGCDAPV